MQNLTRTATCLCGSAIVCNSVAAPPPEAGAHSAATQARLQERAVGSGCRVLATREAPVLRSSADFSGATYLGNLARASLPLHRVTLEKPQGLSGSRMP